MLRNLMRERRGGIDCNDVQTPASILVSKALKNYRCGTRCSRAIFFGQHQKCNEDELTLLILH